MEKPNTALLVEKWSNSELGKLSVESIVDQDQKENMAVLLEAQDKHAKQIKESFNSGLAGTQMNPGGDGAHEPIAMALQRRTYPELFANKIVGVQAMNNPVGLAYALRVMYADGNEAGFEVVPEFSGYTGSTSGVSGTPSDSGTGVSATVAEGWELGTDYPQLSLKVDKTPIEAKSRKLGASYSLETAQDLEATQGINIQREMVNALQYEIQAEMDRELLYTCKDTAVNGTGGEAKIDIDMTASAGTGADGRWSQEKYSNVLNHIVSVQNHIAVTTKRAPANFVVVSPRIATCLQAAGSQFSGNTSAVNPTNTLTEVGTINGNLTVYRDVYATTDTALLGYKGPGVSDCGVIFSPYIMGLMSEAVDGNSFSPRMGVMSRYALTDSLLGAGRYYRLIEFQNLDTYLVK